MRNTCGSRTFRQTSGQQRDLAKFSVLRSWFSKKAVFLANMFSSLAGKSREDGCISNSDTPFSLTVWDWVKFHKLLHCRVLKDHAVTDRFDPVARGLWLLITCWTGWNYVLNVCSCRKQRDSISDGQTFGCTRLTNSTGWSWSLATTVRKLHHVRVRCKVLQLSWANLTKITTVSWPLTQERLSGTFWNQVKQRTVSESVHMTRSRNRWNTEGQWETWGTWLNLTFVSAWESKF